MRNSLTLALVLSCLIGCAGEPDSPADSNSASGLADEVGDASGAAPEASDPAEDQSDVGWSKGDMIPSGREGFDDIKILEVHKNGSGAVCGSGKRATLQYKAMLADGTVLDPGTRPFTFRVGAREAIEGWDIVVAKMRVGDSFTILLPQALAYGPSRGDMKFDMELLSFK